MGSLLLDDVCPRREAVRREEPHDFIGVRDEGVDIVRMELVHTGIGRLIHTGGRAIYCVISDV
jgi:hypothetical protein